MTLLALTRIAWRKKPRSDWEERWQSAGNAVGWKGAFTFGAQKKYQMIATSDSPIWAALARGEGGFRDATGEGQPPFAFGSGLGFAKIDLPLNLKAALYSEFLTKDK